MEETRGKDEERVSRLLSSLPAVEAPGDFEGMVRARVAERRASGPQGSPMFWLALKFAAPMLLLVVLGAFFILSNDGSLNVEMVPPVDAPVVASADLGLDEPPVSDKSSSVREDRTTNRNAGPAPSGPMSQEQALTQDNTTVFPPGVDPRQAYPANMKPPIETRISPSNILSFVGISSVCGQKSCTVKAIQPMSAAERSGVRVGDVIEAIDDRPIGSPQSQSGKVSASSLKIFRDGSRITIPLVFR